MQQPTAYRSDQSVVLIFALIAVSLVPTAILQIPNARHLHLLLEQMLGAQLIAYALTAFLCVKTLPAIAGGLRSLYGTWPTVRGMAASISIGALLFGLTLTLHAFVPIRGSNSTSVANALITNYNEWLVLPTYGLIVCVAAPFTEELVFRGLVFRALWKRIGRWAALAISSVLFAAVHFELLAFPILLVGGLAFGALYMRSGKLTYSIAAHFTFNALTFTGIVLEALRS